MHPHDLRARPSVDADERAVELDLLHVGRHRQLVERTERQPTYGLRDIHATTLTGAASAGLRGVLERELPRSSSSACSRAASAIARSWIARPVESNSVISSPVRRPAASPVSTSPSVVTSSRVTSPASTACASSPPCEACSQSSQKSRARASSESAASALPGPVGAHQRHVLARPERALGEQHLVPGRDRDEQVCGRAPPRATAQLPRRAPRATCRARSSFTSQSSTCRPAREERPRRRPPVHAGADHRGRRRVRTAERLGREHRGGAGAERRHRRRVEHRSQLAVLRVRQQHDAGHRRQPPLRVAGKRRHPLEQRVPSPERRHRAEVARRIVRDVDLRRHRPLAARVRDERRAHRFDAHAPVRPPARPGGRRRPDAVVTAP